MPQEFSHRPLNATPVATGLIWGVKSSLLSYVRRLPDGAISIGEGVGLTPALEFHFPLDDAELNDDLSDVIRFRGTVRMTGHLGMLDLILADPWLHLGEGSAKLSIDPRTGTDDHKSRIEILSMPISRPAVIGDVQEWDRLQPALVASGVELFGMYPVSTSFDPLNARVRRRPGPRHTEG